MFSWGGFKAQKVKPALSQSMIRIGMLKNKKAASIKKSKKAVASFLTEEKVEKARLEAERIVRDDFTIEAYDILELMCELVRDNIKLLESEPKCPYDMVEAVSTLLYVADRTEVPELLIVKEQFIKKYGREFYEAARNNEGGVVNERVLHRISGQRPNAFLVLNYMKEIAKEFAVQWEPDEMTAEFGTRFDAPMVAPNGSSVVPGSASGLGSGAYQVTDGMVIKPGTAPPISKIKTAGPKATQHDDSQNISNNEATSKRKPDVEEPAEITRDDKTDQDYDSLSIENLQARFNAFKNEHKTKDPENEDKEEPESFPRVEPADDLDIPVAPMHPALPTNDHDLPNMGESPHSLQSNHPKDAAVPKFDELLNRFAKLRGDHN